MTAGLTLFVVGACLAAILRGSRSAYRGPDRLLGLAFSFLGTLLAAGYVLLGSSLLLPTPWLDVPIGPIALDIGLPLAAGIFGFAAVWLAVGIRIPTGDSPEDRIHTGWLILPLAVVVAVGFLRSQTVQDRRQAEQAATPTEPAQALTGSTASGIEASLPSGYRVEPIFDERIGSPTVITFGEDGALYISPGSEVLRVPNAIQGGPIEDVQQFAVDIPQALGLAFRDGVLYLSSSGSIYALTDTDGDGQSDEREVILEGLPHFIYDVHSNNGLAFDGHGRLYVGVGGTTDHGPESHPYAGSILEVDVNNGEFDVYARGFRNPFDLAFCPNGDLFATDNGPDQPDEDLLYRPPDEVNLILPSRDYGYPDYFGYPPPWSDSVAPVALLPFSGAATGITCYSAPTNGGGLPDVAEGDLFATLWGSTQVREQTGKRLMHITLRRENGSLVGDTRSFAEGFVSPIDVIQDETGALWLADHGAGQIFRISYED